jgi:hypothetical protein
VQPGVCLRHWADEHVISGKEYQARPRGHHTKFKLLSPGCLVMNPMRTVELTIFFGTIMTLL